MYYRGEEKLFNILDYDSLFGINNAIRAYAVDLSVRKNFCDRIRFEGYFMEELWLLKEDVSLEYFPKDNTTVLYLRNISSQKRVLNEVCRLIDDKIIDTDISIDFADTKNTINHDNLGFVKVKYCFITYKFQDYLKHVKEWLKDEDDNE